MSLLALAHGRSNLADDSTEFLRRIVGPMATAALLEVRGSDIVRSDTGATLGTTSSPEAAARTRELWASILVKEAGR